MEETGNDGRRARTVYQAFLDLLEECIREAGSAYRLSDILGCPPNLITRWRNRDTIPRIDSIQPLVEYLGKGFGVDPTPEQIERRVRTAKDATARADALAKEVDRLRTAVAVQKGEISALERQLRWIHAPDRSQRGSVRAQDGGRSSTGSPTTEIGEEMIAQ